MYLFTLSCRHSLINTRKSYRWTCYVEAKKECARIVSVGKQGLDDYSINSLDICFVKTAFNSYITENGLTRNWIQVWCLNYLSCSTLSVQTTEACYAFITSGKYHKNWFRQKFWKEFEITGKKNIRYGELMREMSSVRCETWTEEEKR